MISRILRSLYGQVILAVLLGISFGYFFPHAAHLLKPLGDVFVKAIKMVIGPVVLCTVVVGIAHVGSARQVGRLGGKALIYFEVVSSLALVVGMAVADLARPGAGLDARLSSLDAAGAADYETPARLPSVVDFLVGLVPGNIADSFARGDLVHILVFAILLGIAIGSMGDRGRQLTQLFEDLGQALLKIVGFVMKLAPLAAFGAMAFTVGNYGVASLAALGKLILCLYAASLFFIIVILGSICRFYVGVSLWKLIRYLREEIVISLATASSEAVLPRMLVKLQNLGCDKQVVGLVIPAGYSFNLDGTSIYVTLGFLFIAQALNIPLTLGQQAFVLMIFLFTSKGVAGVAGGALVVLTATLGATGLVPVAGIALIIAIDRFQNEARSLTNVIGNAVATVALAKSEGQLDLARMHEVLDRRQEPPNEIASDTGVGLSPISRDAKAAG